MSSAAEILIFLVYVYYIFDSVLNMQWLLGGGGNQSVTHIYNLNQFGTWFDS